MFPDSHVLVAAQHEYVEADVRGTLEHKRQEHVAVYHVAQAAQRPERIHH